MAEAEFDRAAAERWFAAAYNNETWDLLEADENEAVDGQHLLATAYAAYRHWLAAGGALERQRGRHLLATVHARLGQVEMAREQARACRDLSEMNEAEQTPFDRACAVDCLARVESLAGSDQAAGLRAAAAVAGAEIPDAADREVYEGLLAAGPWGRAGE